MSINSLKLSLARHSGFVVFSELVISLFLLILVIYEQIYRDYHLIAVLILFTIFCVLLTFSLVTSRNFLVTDYILESSAEINLYALDLDFRFIAVNKNDVRMMEKYFDFTPRLGESPLDIMDGQEVEALKINFYRAMAGESFTVLDKIEKKGEVLYWQCLYIQFIMTIRQLSVAHV